MRDIRVGVEAWAPAAPTTTLLEASPESRHRVRDVDHVVGRLRLEVRHPARKVGKSGPADSVCCGGLSAGARIPAGVSELAGVVRGI